MTTFQEFFKLGMKRDIPTIIPMKEGGKILNLGPGYSHIPNTISLDWPEWDADTQPIPFGDETIDGIHAYHFLEHMRNPRAVLREMQRVMKVGAVANILVPYYTSSMAHQDLDHKAWFTETTWSNAFTDVNYAKEHHGWRFKVGFNVIAGIVERNLCLMTQLIRVE